MALMYCFKYRHKQMFSSVLPSVTEQQKIDHIIWLQKPP